MAAKYSHIQDRGKARHTQAIPIKPAHVITSVVIAQSKRLNGIFLECEGKPKYSMKIL